MSNIILKTQKLTKTYGKFHAVDSMNIEVKEGEIYGLVGKNGAGKTTLLKMITGLSMPDSGKLELFGKTSFADLNKMRANTGCIIETPGFLPYLSAAQNLEYYRLQHGSANKRAIAHSLEFVGLASVGNKKFKNFSLGMKQRLGLALAILDNPKLLILDEPINGLDPMGMAEFREMILKLNQERNTTIIISSHILGELSQIATTYSFIHEGKLKEHITAQDLQEKCKRTLKLRVNDTERTANILRNELACTDFWVEGEGELRLNQYLEAPEKVVQALVQQGILVSEITQTGLNLEEYFIELIGGTHHA